MFARLDGGDDATGVTTSARWPAGRTMIPADAPAGWRLPATGLLRRSCRASLQRVLPNRARSREIASSPLSSSWSDEHVTVEGIETAHGRVEAKAALAVLADDDAGNLVVIPSMVYPSDMSLHAPAMPASSCSDWSVWIAERRQVTAASTTAAGSIQGADAAKHRAERGRRALCHGATPCETESTKTPRGTLAFDDAAQAALRNHRGRVHANFDAATLAAFPATPNQANLQCLFAREGRSHANCWRGCPSSRGHGAPEELISRLRYYSSRWPPSYMQAMRPSAARS